MAQRRTNEVELLHLLARQRLVVDPPRTAVEEPAARRHALADVEDLVLELALRTHRPVGGLLHLDDLRRAVDALDGAERVGPHVQEMDVGAREVHRVGYVLRVVGHDAVFVVRRRARPVPRQVGQEKRAEARGMLEAVGAAGDDRRLYPIAVLRERAEEGRLAVSPLRVGGPERRPLDPAPARHLDAAAELDLAGALGAKDEPRHGGDLERTLQKVAPRLDCNFMRRRLVSRGGRERGGEFLGRADGHRTGRSRRCRRQRCGGESRFHPDSVSHWCELYNVDMVHESVSILPQPAQNAHPPELGGGIESSGENKGVGENEAYMIQ